MKMKYLQIAVLEMLDVNISVCQYQAANSRTVNPFDRQHQFSSNIVNMFWALMKCSFLLKCVNLFFIKFSQLIL